MKKITFLAVLLFASAQISIAQTYFYDDFSSRNLNNWTLVDSDGDTANWYIADLDDGVQEEHATSASWANNVVLNPDNWMISSAIDLTSASGNVSLHWKAYGQDQAWANENYTVYVATSSDIAALGASSTNFNEVIGTSAGYVSRELDVSSFVGQTIYVAFRHHNVSDQFRLNIDDVSVRSNPAPATDIVLKSVELNKYSLINVDNELTIQVKNIGTNPINSVEINWNDGTTDHVSTVSTSIAAGADSTINHPIMVNYATAVEKNITVSVTQVNGATNPSPYVGSKDARFNTMSQAGTKVVLIEESTGTWCGWCPRGTVGLDYMSSTYPESVITVAVHNADPMTIPAYDSALVEVIGSGWPNSGVDRKLVNVDPGQGSLQAAYNEQITEVVPVDMNTTASLVGNTLTISAQATFFTRFSASNFRLAVIITEDGVTGTTNGYAHVNYYAGGANGPMGGYENLPDPVPASQMVYNHVGRAILGGFNGQANSVPTIINDGDTVSYDFTYNIPATSAQENMHIVAVLIDQTDGSIVSGVQRSVDEALSIREFSIAGMKVFPNPANDVLNISFESGEGDYSIDVIDMLGRTVLSKNVNDVFGVQNIEIPVSTLTEGNYILNVSSKKGTFNTKFIKN